MAAAKLFYFLALCDLITKSEAASCQGLSKASCKSASCRWDGEECVDTCNKYHVKWVQNDGGADMPGTSRAHSHNAAVCQTTCRTTSGCKHFSYWPMQQNCHLQDANSKQEIERKALSGSPDCDEVCVQMSYKWEPEDMVGEGRTDADTPEACQDRCHKVSGCQHFSWWFYDGGCHLQDAESKKASDFKAMSGGRACMHPTTFSPTPVPTPAPTEKAGPWEHTFCYDYNKRWKQRSGSADMPNVGRQHAENAEACQARCQSISGCKHFSYWPQQQNCHLQDSSSQEEAFTGAITATPDCSNDCWSMDSTWGPDMNGQGRNKLDTPQACQDRCASVNGCKHFAWWFKDTGCHLQGSNAQRSDEQQTISGPGVCVQPPTPAPTPVPTPVAIQSMPTFCFQYRTRWTQKDGSADMAGNDKVQLETATSCQRRCKKTTGCKHFTYWPKDKNCHLQDADSEKHDDGKAISAEADCSEVCLESDHKWRPLDMPGLGRVETDTPGGCQAACKAVQGCKHFSWWLDGGCHFQDGHARKEKDVNSVSGAEACTQKAHRLRLYAATDGDVEYHDPYADEEVEPEEAPAPATPAAGSAGVDLLRRVGVATAMLAVLLVAARQYRKRGRRSPTLQADEERFAE